MRLKMAQRLIKYGTQLDIVLEKDNLVSPGTEAKQEGITVTDRTHTFLICTYSSQHEANTPNKNHESGVSKRKVNPGPWDMLGKGCTTEL